MYIFLSVQQLEVFNLESILTYFNITFHRALDLPSHLAAQGLERRKGIPRFQP